MSTTPTTHTAAGKPWPRADVIFVDRARVEGQDTFEPGVYLLHYDPIGGRRDYFRAGHQLGQDPDLGDMLLEELDDIISWFEVDTGTLYDLFADAIADLLAGEGSPA